MAIINDALIPPIHSGGSDTRVFCLGTPEYPWKNLYINGNAGSPPVDVYNLVMKCVIPPSSEFTNDNILFSDGTASKWQTLDYLKSKLATVATTNNYYDLNNLPDLDTYATKSSLATIATTGHITDLVGLEDYISQVVPKNITQLEGVPDFDTFARKDQVTPLATNITTINSYIPVGTTPDNKLVNQNELNNRVYSLIANFRGAFATWIDVPADASGYLEDAEGSSTPAAGDYILLQDASTYDATLKGVYRMKYTGVFAQLKQNGWKPEAQLSPYSFSQAQLAAMNSGITMSKVAAYDSYPNLMVAKSSDISGDTKLMTWTGGSLSPNDYTGKAAKATADASGNVITSYYAPKSTVYTKTETDNTFLKKVDAASTYATKAEVQVLSGKISEGNIAMTYSI